MSDLEERIRSFAIGNDSGDALLCRHPSCLHLGSHSSSSTFGVDANLDQLIMDSWAVRLNHPANSELVKHCLSGTKRGAMQRQDECRMKTAHSQQLSRFDSALSTLMIGR